MAVVTPGVAQFLSRAPTPLGAVLEVGSYNVNGSAREALKHASWFGTDLRSGPCVDFVCDAIDLPRYFNRCFDAVVCVETLEHCADWRRTLLAMTSCVRASGMVLLTTPAPGFPRHDYPNDYWRFTKADWLRIIGSCSLLRAEEWLGATGDPHSGVMFTFDGTIFTDLSVAVVA